jgi:hypothetical protein
VATAERREFCGPRLGRWPTLNVGLCRGPDGTLRWMVANRKDVVNPDKRGDRTLGSMNHLSGHATHRDLCQSSPNDYSEV